MSENTPNIPGAPGGAVPPKPAEAAKVQPKKETVRISLPPKPTSSPTIKLPTLPSGGPSVPSAGGATAHGAAPASPPPARPPTTAGSAAPAAAAPAARPPTSTGSAVGRPPGAHASAPRPMAPSSAARRVSGLDVGLGVVAAVIGVGAAVSMALLLSLK